MATHSPRAINVITPKSDWGANVPCPIPNLKYILIANSLYDYLKILFVKV
jgi:hypothetical protein